jgi:hypothetical protein
MCIQLDNEIDIFAMDDTLITRQIMDGPATDTLRSGTASDVEVIEFIDLMINDVVEVEGVAEQDGSIIEDTIEVQLPEVGELP